MTASVPVSWAPRRLGSIARTRLGLQAIAHGRDLVVLAPLLVAVTVLNSMNMGMFPGHLNDDEGTYVAQA